MSQNVLIVGATGAIGRYITAAIVNAKSSFGRISILTSPKTTTEKVEEVTALKSNGVQVKTGSLDDEADVKAAYSGRSVQAKETCGLNRCGRYRYCCILRRSERNR